MSDPIGLMWRSDTSAVLTQLFTPLALLIFSIIKYLLSYNIRVISLSTLCAIVYPFLFLWFGHIKKDDPNLAVPLITLMVLNEAIRVEADLCFSSWKLKKSGERMVRLAVVAHIVCLYTTPNYLKFALLFYCIYSFILEVLNGILFHKAKNSYLVGKNTKLIHKYMKQDDLKTTPMDPCNYIVMGEEYLEIEIRKDGYFLGNTEDALTIGKVFQRNPSDEAPILASPNWRDTCLSLALAKILMLRFANLPLDKVRTLGTLDFLQQGLTENVGHIIDISPKASKRVFSIIKVELRFVSDFLHNKVPAFYYSDLFNHSWSFKAVICHLLLGLLGLFCHTRTLSLNVTSINNSFSVFIEFFTIFFLHATVFILGGKLLLVSDRWLNIYLVKRHIRGAKLSQVEAYILDYIYCWLPILSPKKGKGAFCEFEGTILDICKNEWRRKLGITFNSFPATDVQETIWRSLKGTLNSFSNSPGGGKLTNGETALKKCVNEEWIWIHKEFPNYFSSYGLEEQIQEEILLPGFFRRVWMIFFFGNKVSSQKKTSSMLSKHKPSDDNSGSTSETILIWHIATILFDHQNPLASNNDDKENRMVAMELCRYCYYLVATLPELLPDDHEWTEKICKKVREDIFVIDRKFKEKYIWPFNNWKRKLRSNRCNHILILREKDKLKKNSVVEKGAKLAKLLNDIEVNRSTNVWEMLSKFWTEMMLFISPSDNVKGHEVILEREEFITQLWALFTHAGILKSSQYVQPPNQSIQPPTQSIQPSNRESAVLNMRFTRGIPIKK